jgi:C1A family cysteine protease
MKLVSSLLFAAVVVASDPLQAKFVEWAQQYNKTYSVDETFHRFQIWKANLADIEEHNAGNHSWTKGMNKFGDLTGAEFKKLMTRPQGGYTRKFTGKPYEGNATLDSIDWREKGAVTSVKDQGNCGSCYTFSAAAALEGTNFVKNGELYDLSEQQLIDCDTKENDGCDGGLEVWAYEDYVEPNGGLCKLDEYGPYKAKKGSCKDKDCKAYAPIKGVTEVKKGEENLAAALEEHPSAVGVEAADNVWQFYSSGVADGKCGTQIDHGVTAVGFGTTSTIDYWIIKNSWGKDWGEDGYIRLAKAGHGKTYNGKSGQCGVSAEPCFPISK